MDHLTSLKGVYLPEFPADPRGRKEMVTPTGIEPVFQP